MYVYVIYIYIFAFTRSPSFTPALHLTHTRHKNQSSCASCLPPPALQEASHTRRRQGARTSGKGVCGRGAVQLQRGRGEGLIGYMPPAYRQPVPNVPPTGGRRGSVGHVVGEENTHFGRRGKHTLCMLHETHTLCQCPDGQVLWQYADGQVCWYSREQGPSVHAAAAVSGRF